MYPRSVVQELKQRYPHLLMVDYTLPDAIHSMVNFYVQHNTPFVMGTTGGDRAKIHAQVRSGVNRTATQRGCVGAAAAGARTARVRAGSSCPAGHSTPASCRVWGRTRSCGSCVGTRTLLQRRAAPASTQFRRLDAVATVTSS